MKLQKLIILILIGLAVQTSFAGEQVNVYSYRKPALIQPMLEVFTQDSGIEVNVVYAKKGMLERLKREGRNTPADIVFTVDIGRLSDIKQAGLTQSVKSKSLAGTIPESQRDVDNHWFGLTQHARFIVASKDRVEPGELKTYEDLAKAKFSGRICTRSGKHPYMVALLASMMVHHGEKNAEKWLIGVKNNLARKPQGNDRAQVKAIKEGQCDIAIINHYYMFKMLSDPEQVPWAKSVNVIFPNQKGRGTHMNISGMAMTKYSKQPANALKLMEFLADAKAQEMYSKINGEYPVQENIPSHSHLKEWGEFKRDNVALTKIAGYRSEAIKMMDRVAYNE